VPRFDAEVGQCSRQSVCVRTGGMITTSTLSRLSWGDVGVDALDALSCPVNEPPVRVAQR
jgi:hypothetical protein